MQNKFKLATCSLAGCFGCHMSFLDIDEGIAQLLDHYQFDRSPLTDIKTLGDCDVGLVEGGLCNQENQHVLRTFRQRCRILVAVGVCAISGGIPALRNQFSVDSCLRESYLDGLNVVDGQIPLDPELPPLLAKVQPIQQVVKVDYFLPGCPPPASAFEEILMAVAEGREPKLDYQQRHFD